MAPSEPQLRQRLVELVRTRGHQRRAQAFRLSSGELSHDYVDLRRALARGPDLRLAADAVVAHARQHGAGFDAVGGMTMGADPLAHAVALVTGTAWFSVRKQAKEHGAGRRVEGAELGPGVAVLLVEDTVTTGGSLLRALDAVADAGAEVVLATAILDRGDTAGPALATRGVAYAPLLTYRDLGIDPVG